MKTKQDGGMEVKGGGGGWVGGQACGTAAVKKAVLNIHSVPDVQIPDLQ